MAKGYNLQPNEVVLLKDESVCHGGFFSAYTDQLILTNLNLVIVKKGVFGNAKGILAFPINQIKVWNNQAQALLGKASNGFPQLEVYFLNSQENFLFQSGGKKKILDWVAKINQVATGQQATTTQPTPGLALPGAELVAGALKDTFDVFKGRFGAKTSTPTQVAGKCRSCGAPIAGVGGQVATCQYCGAPQQL